MTIDTIARGADGFYHPGSEAELVVDVRGSVSEDDVRRWCAERLSAYKQPSAISVS